MVTTTITWDAPPTDARTDAGEPYAALVARLARQSVTKHFDAYADVDWDAPEHWIDPNDPRWELSTDDALGATEWYQAQPPLVRSRLGLHMVATRMRLGRDFERVLKMGLLGFIESLPATAPELRYAYHEVIEEAQHSLMFYEFVRRTGLDVPGLGWLDRLGSRRVARFGRRFPELFFLFVLGGEEPIDHVQRELLRAGSARHPLGRRISQIHVTEEARHICFAREYLRERVPRLGALRRLWLALEAPLLLAVMTRQMLEPPRHLVRTYGIPQDVVAAAYHQNPRHHAAIAESMRKVRELCVELGLAGPWARPVWRRLGIWADATA